LEDFSDWREWNRD